jgi:ketosteroid isomerase-like protein
MELRVDFGMRARLLRQAQCIGLSGVVLMAGCHSTWQGLPETSRARAADEATIRRLDGDWVKAAASKHVDAWMIFYAKDAVVLPPNDKIATSTESIRKSVGELLSLPGLVLTWQLTKVEVAASGDMAYLYGAYEITSNDAHGKPITEYGKNVEIWKKQLNGTWKCAVDTWNSDLPPLPVVPPSGS